MGTTTYQTGAEFRGDNSNNDPFHDPIVLGIGIALIVITVAMLAIAGVYYWGSLYDAPSWGANSFPAPMTY
jgi:hypothetical protein